MINIGVIGVGSIGMHHARIYSELEDVHFAGLFDSDVRRAEEIASKYPCRVFGSYQELIANVDAVSIAVPTTLHYEVASACLKHNRHILVEKPVTTTLDEADRLIEEADRKNLVFQVGHLERFNAGVSMISAMVDNPQFIETQRLSPFLGRGTDVDVTLDLMIHDIDIILSLVNSDIADMRATGAKVFTDNIDIAHAWIEFENGCIAEAVSSRIAGDKKRELKVFQHNAYLNLDYQKQEVSSYTKHNGNVEKEVKMPEFREPLKEQLIAFIECIKNSSQPLVSGREGKEALKVVLKISGLVKQGGTI
ncbi:MAG: Gfo/Idh/MocA family oxidoreductase [Nitrospirota bacterium]